MRFGCHILHSLALVLMGSFFAVAHGQLGFHPVIEKPKQYEERVLRAEKSADKKLALPKRFFQNLTTHFNYYFNASNKLNLVIEESKKAHRDDYSELLPFYNYSLDQTANQKTELDSVINKSQTGLVMHDLRSDWADNMYLLWGAAYFLEKKFDSAALMFQFINYSFAQKEEDGYYKYIGSRLDGGNALSVSTKEERNLLQKIFNENPSRNDAFIWQIRTLIETGDFAQSGSLIATLRTDPLFPARLQYDLDQVHSLWFYRQGVWDSAAVHLEKSLEGISSKGERGRYEYLTAQLYEKSGKPAKALDLYASARKNTTDPVLDVFARLNMVRVNTNGQENFVDENIAELLKMARRDRYLDYRDVIYYMAAKMELERQQYDPAQRYLILAAKYNNGNLSSQNNAYLLIASLSYQQRKYREAARFYDSVKLTDLKPDEITEINKRKQYLGGVIASMDIVKRQDSLIKIAAMPEAEREAFLNSLVKKMRREAGLDDAVPTAGSTLPQAGNDLFASTGGNNNKGEWYFYNETLKTQGAVKFKQTWGTRPNVDNWRRFSDVNKELLANLPTKTREPGKEVDAMQALDNTPSYNGLLASLPLTEEQVRKSNDSIRTALYSMGMIYLEQMDDMISAAETFEEIRKRFPNAPNMDDIIYRDYYAQLHKGDSVASNRLKNELLTSYPNSRFASILKEGRDPMAQASNPEITKEYENIYNMYLEGRFAEAENAKRIADSIHHTTVWNQQLLYIESVYQISQRQDSVAKNTLQTLIAQAPNSVLGQKATDLLQVLNRRAEIEAELTALQVTRPAEDTSHTTSPFFPRFTAASPTVAPPITTPAAGPTVPVKDNPPPVDTVAIKGPTAGRSNGIASTRGGQNPGINVRPANDTSARVNVPKPKPAATYKFVADEPHYVVVLLNKVDPVFQGEAVRAFNIYSKQRYYGKPYSGSLSTLDENNKLILIGGFASAQEALDFLEKAKPLAPKEIVPWLKGDKYSFLILGQSNTNLLLEKKDIPAYKQFLEQNLPGKF